MSTSRLRGSGGDALLRVLLIFIALALWQAATSTGFISPRVLPSITSVAERLADWAMTGSVLPHIQSTLFALVLGLVAGTVSGMVVGIMLAAWKPLADISEPFLAMINAVPRAALAPLFILWFGIGLVSKVAFATILIFFHTFISTYSGLKSVDDQLLRHSRMLGASKWQVFTNVKLPAVAVWVMASLRTSVGFAVIGVIIGEYLGSTKGIGFLLANAESRLALDAMVAALVVLLAIVAAMNLSIRTVENRFAAWRLF